MTVDLISKTNDAIINKIIDSSQKVDIILNQDKASSKSSSSDTKLSNKLKLYKGKKDIIKKSFNNAKLMEINEQNVPTMPLDSIRRNKKDSSSLNSFDEPDIGAFQVVDDKMKTSKSKNKIG